MAAHFEVTDTQDVERDSPSLDQLPVRDGFRTHGTNGDRIGTSTDAAVAFALNPLVSSSDAPRDRRSRSLASDTGATA